MTKSICLARNSPTKIVRMLSVQGIPTPGTRNIAGRGIPAATIPTMSADGRRIPWRTSLKPRMHRLFCEFQDHDAVIQRYIKSSTTRWRSRRPLRTPTSRPIDTENLGAGAGASQTTQAAQDLCGFPKTANSVAAAASLNILVLVDLTQ